MAAIGYKILSSSMFNGIKGYSCQDWSLQSEVFSEDVNGFRGLGKKSNNTHRFKVGASVFPPLEIKRGESKVIDPTIGSIKNPKHVAWESVPRERWAGEVEVEGYIPEWLVSIDSLHFCVFALFLRSSDILFY